MRPVVLSWALTGGGICEGGGGGLMVLGGADVAGVEAGTGPGITCCDCGGSGTVC